MRVVECRPASVADCTPLPSCIHKRTVFDQGYICTDPLDNSYLAPLLMLQQLAQTCCLFSTGASHSGTDGCVAMAARMASTQLLNVGGLSHLNWHLFAFITCGLSGSTASNSKRAGVL